MDFVKMEGLGNDFVVVDGPVEVTPGDVRRWCDRRRGIGADGVLEVVALEPGRVGMRYWNGDGAAAEMCGNGLRCVARLVHDRGWVGGPRFVVSTPVGDRPVVVRPDGSVRALLGEPAAIGGSPMHRHGVEWHRVSVGNPHAVTFVDDPARAAVPDLGPKIEGDPELVEGTNVEFAAVTDRHHMVLRVWERGVGETLACGTGAAAGVFAAHHLDLTEPRVTVELAGGPLLVELADDGAWIEGPARVVFTGSTG